MKILLCHNYYQQRGGEDESFEDEARLLESRGHEVLRYTLHNDVIDGMSKLQAARRCLWNPQTYRELRSLLRRERPEVMHCTNLFPLISPSAYSAARAEGVPVVQALRNYRSLCPSALLLRDGRVCEDCLGKAIPWPAVAHGCYRDSRAASAVVAALLVLGRARQKRGPQAHAYYTLTEFARQKLVQGGLPAERISVKSNFVHPDPGPGSGRGGYAIFVGRLSAEKGLDTLLAAWPLLSAAGVHLPLRIVGDGPLAKQVRAAASADGNIQWLGRRPLDDTLRLIGEAACLVMPSIWYETFGRTIIEAFAKGTPVVASRLGAMAELVANGRTGRHFQPGDPRDLANQIGRLMSSPAQLAAMRTAARQEYESKYTAASNYHVLMSIYARALAVAREGTSAKTSFRRPSASALGVATRGDEPRVSVAAGQQGGAGS